MKIVKRQNFKTLESHLPVPSIYDLLYRRSVLTMDNLMFEVTDEIIQCIYG